MAVTSTVKKKSEENVILDCRKAVLIKKRKYLSLYVVYWLKNCLRVWYDFLVFKSSPSKWFDFESIYVGAFDLSSFFWWLWVYQFWCNRLLHYFCWWLWCLGLLPSICYFPCGVLFERALRAFYMCISIILSFEIFCLWSLLFTCTWSSVSW